MIEPSLQKKIKTWHNVAMSFLELQHQVEKLPVPERVALMNHIKHTLTDIELEAFWVEEAEQIVDLIDLGKMKTFTLDELRKRRAERITS